MLSILSCFLVAVIMNIVVVLKYIRSLFPICLPSSFNWLNVTESLLENELMPNTSDFVKSALLVYIVSSFRLSYLCCPRLWL